MFPVEPTTSRIGDLTRLIHTLLQGMTMQTFTFSVYLVFGIWKQVMTGRLLLIIKNILRNATVRTAVNNGNNRCVWRSQLSSVARAHDCNF